MSSGHTDDDGKTGLERILSWLDDPESRSDAAIRAIEDENRY